MVAVASDAAGLELWEWGGEGHTSVSTPLQVFSHG